MRGVFIDFAEFIVNQFTIQALIMSRLARYFDRPADDNARDILAFWLFRPACHGLSRMRLGVDSGRGLLLVRAVPAGMGGKVFKPRKKPLSQ